MLNISILDIVMTALGLFFLLTWLYFFKNGSQYEAMFEPLDDEEFQLKQIFSVGYAIMEKTGYQYKSKNDRKLRKEVSVLYGEKYADYYIRVTYAQKISIAFTLLVIAFPMYGLADSIAITFVMIMFAGLAYYYYGTLASKKIQERSNEMLCDFSDVVSKLALLTNAGMILREAWEEVAFTGEGVIYKEMQTAVEDMNNGVSEIDALFSFGSRCIIPEIKKFTSTIVQGIIKGNSELTMMLQEQSKEVWDLKKQNVRRQGEKAASKLLVPILVMFIGILIMVLIPIFTNLGA